MADLLPIKTESLDNVPEALREFYEQDTDKDGNEVHRLKVDMKEVKAEIKSFRDNNIGLKKEQETLQSEIKTLKESLATYDGIEVEDYNRLVKAEEEWVSGNKKDSSQEDLDALLNRRTEKMRRDHEAQTKTKDKTKPNLSLIHI